jgi:drug/metabolite transporter (DMT)-like permease
VRIGRAAAARTSRAGGPRATGRWRYRIVNNTALFLVPALIWGSTWHAITWQLGTVAEEVSVTYRFAAASLLVALGCVATRRSLRFSRRDHAFLAGLGLTMICVNYNFIYWAERTIVSGLVAVVYSTVVFMTPVGMRVAFGVPLQPRLFAAAALGVVGVALLFLPELAAAGRGGSAALGVGLVLAAAAACVLGNLIAVRNHRAGIATVPGTAWAMAYGAAFAALAAMAHGAPWTFDARPAYAVSLAYLSVFGSVVAFIAYFTLLKRVGAGPSSYIAIATPVLAMLMSTLFEGYRWTWIAGLGVVLAGLGNWLALRAAPGAPPPE